jgi:multidrug resistance protein
MSEPEPTRSVATEEKDLENGTAALPARTATDSSSRTSSEQTEPDPADLSRRHSNLEKGVSAIVPIEQRVSASQQDTSDPNVVDWDGPNDPTKALNWPAKKKWSNIAVISSITFLTPLASSMFAPGIPELMREFHSSNQTIASFVVSVYVLGYAIGPLIIAPLSELYGRLIIYHACNVLFLVFTIACAVAPNMGSLIFFRLMEGCAGSAPLTIGGGSIADMIVQEKRGGAMAIFALGPLLGPVIGPVAGGYVSQAKGWRWVFWVITMAGGALAISSFIFMRETYEPTLLGRRTARLRNETNNPNLYSKFENTSRSTSDIFLKAIVRPTKMLFLSPIVFVLSLYMAVVYGYLYLLFTTLTLVFEYKYHFSSGNVGLTFLGIGVGSLLGLVIFGLVSDALVKHMARKGEMKPEYRLPPLIPGSLLIPIGLFWYGWTAEKGVHWILPILGTMFVGLGLMATFMPINTYLVDAYTIHAASAMAASTVLRSLAGAFLPLAGPKMYAALGLGWGNSLLAFVALAMSPMTWVFFKYGERIRKSRRFQLDL